MEWSLHEVALVFLLFERLKEKRKKEEKNKEGKKKARRKDITALLLPYPCHRDSHRCDNAVCLLRGTSRGKLDVSSQYGFKEKF